MKENWRRFRNILFRHVLHTDDTPHRIALGTAIAVLVAFTPTLGFQMVIALGIAAILRANKAICIPVVWISNPVTVVPIYVACWQVGRRIMPVSTGDEQSFAQRIVHLVHVTGDDWTSLFQLPFWGEVTSVMVDFGVELWVGSLVLGTMVAGVSYFFTRWTVTEYRQRRRVKKIHRNMQRARLQQARSRRALARRAAV